MTPKAQKHKSIKANEHKFHSSSVRVTRAFAKKIAKQILAQPHKKYAAVVGLIGDLGAGKTTFAQAFARALGIRRRILSPTFILFRHYSLSLSKDYRYFYHVDAYRITNPKELLALGFKKIFADPKNIVLIEWAEHAADVLPNDTLWIHLAHGKTVSERTIDVRGGI